MTDASELASSPTSAIAKQLRFSDEKKQKRTEFTGYDEGIIWDGRYAARWEKEARVAGQINTMYKHGHVYLRLFKRLNGLKFKEISGIDVTMEYLPSEESPTGSVELFNYIVWRSASKDGKAPKQRCNNDIYHFERVALTAILSMYDPELRIVANPSLDVGFHVGDAAHTYLAKQLELDRDIHGQVEFQRGRWLQRSRTSRYFGFFERTPSPPPSSSAEARIESEARSMGRHTDADTVRSLNIEMHSY